MDTNVAIHLRDGDPAAKERLAQLDAMPFLSSITRVELEGGVYAIPALSAKRRHAVDAMLEAFDCIDFDDGMAATYGRIVAATGFSRRKIIDRMIAATALAYNLTIITMNVDDFSDVPGLRVENWGKV